MTDPTTKRGVDTPRREYSEWTFRWMRCRDVINGTDAVKFRGIQYLPRLLGQDDGEYEAYKIRANFYGGTARTRDALAGTLFRLDPTTQVPAQLDPLIDDVTLNDVPLPAFALTAVEEILTLGRYGILVDVSGDDVPVSERRPYLVGYTGEQIINWKTAMRGGRMILSQVVLRERAENPDGDWAIFESTEYRVLELTNPENEQLAVYTITQYKQSAQSKEYVAQTPVTPIRRGQPLNFIPFVFLGPTALTPVIAKPPLLDMVDINLSLYRTSADLENGRHFTSLPTPWIAGAPRDGAPLRIGSTVAWLLDENGKAGFLEYTGQGLSALESAVKEKLEQMAVLGARMIEAHSSGQPETAEAVRARHAATHATLKTIGTTASLGLSKALRWMAWWAAATDNLNETKIVTTLNREFSDNKLSSDELKTLLLAVQAEKMSFETFYYLLSTGGWARDGITAAQEKKQIESENPAPPIVLTETGVKGQQPGAGAPVPIAGAAA